MHPFLRAKHAAFRRAAARLLMRSPLVSQPRFPYMPTGVKARIDQVPPFGKGRDFFLPAAAVAPETPGSVPSEHVEMG